MSSSEPEQDLLWTTAEWQREAHEWIAQHLSAAGRGITGPIEQPHIRPWATAFRVPASGGDVWFKAVAPRLRHEARLTEFLWSLLPGHTPDIIATDHRRGWLLLEDLGSPLRPHIRSFEDLRWWDQSLNLYADLQKAAAFRSEELVATGVPDRRDEGLHHEWEELLGDVDRLRIGEEECLSREHFDLAVRLWGEIAALLAELDDVGLPNTIVHDDLHDHNVFLVGEEGKQRIILADWGDSSFANPLCTLTVLLSSMAYQRGVEVDAPAIVAVEERYLSHWEDHASMAQIREGATIAKRIGMLHRALTWRNAILSAPHQSVSEYADAVPGWLDGFVETFEERSDHVE